MKRIKKVSQTIPTSAQIVDGYAESSTDGYSCDYINNHDLVVSPTEPTTDRAKVWLQKGKNLVDISKLPTYESYGLTFTHTTTGIQITGTSNQTYAYGGKIPITLKNGVTYILSGTNAGNILKINLYNISGTNVGSAKTVSNEISFTPTDDIVMIQFVLEGITSSTSYNFEISNIQIEQGAIKSSYEAYIKPQTYILNDNNIYEKYNKVISGTTTDTTDSSGRILIPIPMNAKCISTLVTSNPFFSFARKLSAEESICYVKNPDDLQAQKNVSVTVNWSYIED